MIKPVLKRERKPSSSVTTRSTRSMLPRKPNSSWICPISMRRSGSPMGLEKVPTTSRVPRFVSIQSPACSPSCSESRESISTALSLVKKESPSLRVACSIKEPVKNPSRTPLSRRGSKPIMRSISPPGRMIFLSITGEKAVTAGSRIKSVRRASPRGPAGRLILWVAVPLRKVTVRAKCERAD